MNKARFLVGLLFVAVLVMFAPASHAQQATNCQSAGYVNGNGVAINCNVIAVGSSAIFPSAAIAASTGDPQRGTTGAPLCGSNFWTGSANGRDSRATSTNPNIPLEPGTVWIAWDNSVNPTIICAYLSVDSIVGQRLFYGQGTGASGATNNGQLVLGTSACTTVGANKVAFIWDSGSALPVPVFNALQGNPFSNTTCTTGALPVNFTTASTDVHPADALFVGNQRVLGVDGNASANFPADGKGSLGYGGTNAQGGSTCLVPGPAVASSYETATIANAICYTYVGGQPDPITGTAIPSSTIVDEAALSMIPFVNVLNTTPGGFGDLFNNHGFNDVLSHDLAAGYALSQYGTAAITRDLFLGSNNVNGTSIAVMPIHYLTREPMSGTYTTWEWQVLRNKESALGGGGLSAETNVCGPSQAAAGCAYNTPANNAAACPNQALFLTNKVFPPTLSCSNYMSWGINFNALKTRVLGTGEMVSVSNVNASAGGPSGSPCTVANFGTEGGPCIQDTFGYAFWSLGSFGGKNNIRYLQLDSNDGLYAGWSSSAGGNNGAFPLTNSTQGTSATPGAPPADGCSGYFNGNGGTVTSFSCNTWNFPTFANVVSGNYRVWSINRVVWYGALPNGTTIGSPVFTAAGLNPPGFWLSAADQAAPTQGVAPNLHGVIPDFMPFAYCASAAACPSGGAPQLTYPLNAFRSHYTVPQWNIGAPNNGITGNGFGGAENGADVAGGVITVQAEADSVSFFGDSFLAWIQ